jgi:prepilin-type N-terminal cleavage/methylation domain-containing protein
MTRGFSLLETLAALAVAAILGASVAATFGAALVDQGRGKREWAAFTIAEQTLELLASLPPDTGLLSPNSTSTTPGTPADVVCSDVPPGPQHYRTDALGTPVADGGFEVCIKVTAGNPVGSLRNVRVVVLYDFRGNHGLLLQTVR